MITCSGMQLYPMQQRTNTKPPAATAPRFAGGRSWQGLHPESIYLFQQAHKNKKPEVVAAAVQVAGLIEDFGYRTGKNPYQTVELAPKALREKKNLLDQVQLLVSSLDANARENVQRLLTSHGPLKSGWPGWYGSSLPGAGSVFADAIAAVSKQADAKQNGN